MINGSDSDPQNLRSPIHDCDSDAFQTPGPELTRGTAYENNGRTPEEAMPVISIRERLKKHREEVAGKVTVPEKWGQEELLKDWIDCTAFDRLFAAGRIATARESLVAEGRRASSRPVRVEGR